MIFESLVDILFSVLTMALSGFEAVGLPLQLINALNTIICFGVWVVGADVLSLFAVSVVGWWSAKFIAGLVVFFWELLPFT